MTRNDGEQRSVSRREVLKFAGSAPVLLSLGMLAATLGAQKASAADIRLIDFTERLVPPEQIKSAGFDGVIVYVSELRPGANFDFKPVTREYADALRAADLHTPGCGVQPQSCSASADAALIPAGVVRRRRPTGLSVLVDAGDVKIRRA